VGFENKFNDTTFDHHFCVKTGVNISAEFLCYFLASETYSFGFLKQKDFIWDLLPL
jgi:hypothetical protein